MAEFIQSNGRIGVLQQFMFENEALLDKIPGIDIERTKIGSKTGEIDNILGKGTATAIESILMAAGIPEGSDFNADAQAKLSEFLTKNGMNAAQVSTFVKDVGVVVNDKDLGPIYQRNAKADTVAIHKAPETDKIVQAPASEQEKQTETPVPAKKEGDKGPEGEDEPEKDKKNDDEHTSRPMYAKGNEPELHNELLGANVKVDDAGKVTIEDPVVTVEKQIVAPPDERIAMSTIKPGAFVNSAGRIVEPQEIKPVISEEQYASIVEEFGIGKDHVVLASVHKPTMASPKPEDNLLAPKGGEEMVLASTHGSTPSFSSLSIAEPFMCAKLNFTPISLDADKTADFQVTISDIKKMQAKEELSPDEKKLVAIVEGKHEALINSNPKLAAVTQQKEALLETNAAHRDGLKGCHQNVKATAIALDDKMAMFESKHGDKTLHFNAVVDGEMTTLHLSRNQLLAGDIPGVGMLEFLDRAGVREAGYAKFLEVLPAVEKEAYADYTQKVAEFHEDATKLIGAENMGDPATENFEEHLASLNVFENLKHGEFNIDMNGLYALENQEWKMERDIGQEVYIVKQSEIDAFDPNKDAEMIAKNDPDPASTIPSTM